MKNITIYLLIIANSLVAQNCEINESSISWLKKDIEYLSDDKLEGRETGTQGEILALEYLESRFHEVGLKTNVHEFEFKGEVEVSYLSSSDLFCYPTKYSSNGSVDNAQIIDVKFGIDANDLNYSDYINLDVVGKVVLINTGSPDGIHPHSKYLNYHDLKKRAEIAREKGAIAVIYYTDDNYSESPKEKFKTIISSEIPVLFCFKLSQDLINRKISFSVSLKESFIKGRNLIAEINNLAKNTIVIGAHYDHLGWGKEGSLYRGVPSIHNGADDNASGTAALLELARFYNTADYKNYNYLFVAFSGEEKGLLGSNSYVKSNLINLENINYMINLDMIGRLNSEGKIHISGTGTSPRWEGLLSDNYCENISVVSSESGIGASDHTSFYLEEIPVLHFFTGAHNDYHKPSDDAEKINYEGVSIIISYLQNLINDLDNEPKIEFSKTKEADNNESPKFSVTLGIIPDYLYDNDGLRIDGISDGRPAQNAGLKKGDIIIELGGVRIRDIISYMKALGYFVKGDKTNVVIIRSDQELNFNVIF